jgi:hypothetical protein
LNGRAWLLAAGLAAGACYPTTVRSGAPASPETVATHWHHAFFFGLLDASGPYRLDELCPGGWSEVHSEMPPAAGLLRVVSLGLYAPAEVRIVCAAPQGQDTNSVSEGPLPPIEWSGDAGARE